MTEASIRTKIVQYNKSTLRTSTVAQEKGMEIGRPFM